MKYCIVRYMNLKKTYIKHVHLENNILFPKAIELEMELTF